jgi:hypothetical protein
VHVAGRNYDQTLTLATDVGTVALGHSAAERVWVTTESDYKNTRRPKS